MYFPNHNLPYVLSSVFMPQSLSPAGISVYTGKIATCEFTWKELHVIMKFTCSFHMNSVWIVREIHVKIFTWVSLLTLVSREKFHVKFTWISYVAILPVYRCMAGVSNISYIGPHRLNNPEAHIVLRLSKRCSCNMFFNHFRLVVGQTPMVILQWQTCYRGGSRSFKTGGGGGGGGAVEFLVAQPMSVPSVVHRSHIDAYWSDIVGYWLVSEQISVDNRLMFVHKVPERCFKDGWGPVPSLNDHGWVKNGKIKKYKEKKNKTSQGHVHRVRLIIDLVFVQGPLFRQVKFFHIYIYIYIITPVCILSSSGITCFMHVQHSLIIL